MKNTTKLYKLFFLALITSCSSDDGTDRGNWVDRSVFDGVPRSNAVNFMINGNGYMGTGYDGDDYLNDFWEYNVDGDFWSQKADFPSVARSSAIGFSINQKGYLGTGYDGDNDRKDFWKYNPSTDLWTEVVGFGGDKRRDATSFIIDDNVYIGTGISNGLYVDDFWQFNLTSEVWTRKRDLTYDDAYTITRSNAVGFTIDGLGYISTGYLSGALLSTWEYNPSTDIWEQLTNLEATARQDASVFSTGSRGFVLLGRSGGLYLDDTYEFFPLQDFDDED